MKSIPRIFWEGTQIEISWWRMFLLRLAIPEEIKKSWDEGREENLKHIFDR